MRRLLAIVVLFTVVFVAPLAVPVLAHETKIVGDAGQYSISFGFVEEPIYTNERNGLDIIVRRTGDGTFVNHLEQTMVAEIVSPDGTSRRQLPLRAVWGEEGRYTADVALTEPGTYEVRLRGFIFDTEFDETFQTHEVTAFSELTFP